MIKTMTTSEKNISKKLYQSPKIAVITLDNEISLALESNPPYRDDETILTPKYITNDPFKNQMIG